MYEEEHHTRITEPHEPHETHSRTTFVSRPGRLGVIERAIIYLFGLIQIVLALRILLLLVAAREGNNIVSFVYDVSDVFVAPFRGILQLDQVAAGRSELDIAAIVALIGWTVIELIVIGLIRIARPTTA